MLTNIIALQALRIAELERLAYFDDLTGLPNGRAYQRRQTTGKESIIFLDVDRFKQINDTLGHDAGNEVLRAIAATIQSVTRAEGDSYRIHGDEFIVAVRADLDHAQTIAQRIAEAVRTLDLHQVSLLSVSYGVGRTKAEADGAMYRMKRCRR